jgi:hypothetical protein
MSRVGNPDEGAIQSILMLGVESNLSISWECFPGENGRMAKAMAEIATVAGQVFTIENSNMKLRIRL